MEQPGQFATRLRLLRAERNLTQVDAAAEIGISRSHLAKLETEGDLPGRETLESMAAVYDVSLDWLSGKSAVRGQSAAKTKEEALLLYAFRELPPAEAKPLLEMLLKRVEKSGN